MQVEAESKLAATKQLQESGVPELDTSIETLRNQVAALGQARWGPDWEGLGAWIAGGLDDAS